MSDLTQIKTVTGVASGFNDTSARQSITELSGAIDYVSANAGGGLTGDFSGTGQPITFTDKNGKILYNDKMVLTNDGLSAHSNYNYGFYSDLRIDNFNGISAYEGDGLFPEYAWGLNSSGVYFYDGPHFKNWSGIKNTDLGLTTDGTISSISGHELDVPNIQMVSTSSEATGANILYVVTGSN